MKSYQITLLLIIAFIAGWFSNNYIYKLSENGWGLSRFTRYSNNDLEDDRARLSSGESLQIFRQYLEQREYQQAINLISSADLEDQRIMKHWLVEYTMKLLVGEPEQGEILINQYLSSDAESPSGRFLKILLLAYKMSYREAIEHLYELNTVYQDEVSEDTLNQQFSSLIQQYVQYLKDNKEISELVDFYSYLIQRDKNPARYYYQLAYTHYTLGNYQQGLNTLDYIYYDSVYSKQAQQLYQQIKDKLKRQAQTEIPLMERSSQFFVDVDINSYTVKLLIDTGASISTINSSIANELDLMGAHQSNIIVNTAGGKVRVPVVAAQSFGLSNYIVFNFDLGIIDMPEDSAIDGLLGMDYLGRFKFYIDQQESILYISE